MKRRHSTREKSGDCSLSSSVTPLITGVAGPSPTLVAALTVQEKLVNGTADMFRLVTLNLILLVIPPTVQVRL